MFYNLTDTICAQSTPSGRGGIHVIRVSGQLALEVVSKCFKPFQNVKSVESHKVYYGIFISPKSNESLDEVLATYFREGQSFTAETTVEISTHGNPVIVKNILDVLTSLGCRLAEKGEFSYRAYKNGRISAYQAEALLSVIESNTQSSISKSLDLLQGDVKYGLDEIRSNLIWLVSRLEAKIDFSTEDIEIDSLEVLVERMEKIALLVSQSLRFFNSQKILEKGVKTLVLGPPNVGKSSLFNFLVGKQRSIVSDVAGTTRDYVSEIINVRGKSFEMIDTAGIRYSTDDIEVQGIKSISDLVKISDLIILLVSPETQDLNFLNLIDGSWKEKNLLFVVNKSELVQDEKKFKEAFYSSLKLALNSDSSLKLVESPTTAASRSEVNFDLLKLAQFISVKNQKGLDTLLDEMASIFDNKLESDPIGIVSLRQYQELKTVLDEVTEAQQVLVGDHGDELVLFHLNRALKSVMNIFHVQDEEVIRDQIFKDFCLGK